VVEGKDDLRQDAVMQQIFQMVNTFLKENVETRKRQLNIKTYKVRYVTKKSSFIPRMIDNKSVPYEQVIPLTPCSGVLEWVQNSIPLGTYLVGSPQNPKASAHYLYFLCSSKNSQKRVSSFHSHTHTLSLSLSYVQ
jgi:ataxia telangiectasia mutated family protein